jgi:hypothetical protein
MLLDKTGFRLIYLHTSFKYLTFDYIVGHFKRHTPGVLTSLLSFLELVLPSALKNKPIYLPTEMIAVAERSTSLVSHDPPSAE